MKYSLLFLSGLLALSSATAVQSPQKSYDRYKVVRLSVGEDVAKVTNMINRLGLTTWKGNPRAGAAADIVVPPSQIDAFEAEIAGMGAITMHENLGASIAEESTFSVYAGSSQEIADIPSPADCHLKPDLRILRGLTPTIPTRITSSFSETSRRSIRHSLKSSLLETR